MIASNGPRGGWALVAVAMAACGGSRHRDAGGGDSDIDVDSDVDTDSDGDTDSDSESDVCDHPAEAAPCEGSPRAGSGFLDEEACVPGGWFLMGTREEPPKGLAEMTAHWVQVSPLFLDRYPVTVERYRRCVDAGACSPPPSGGTWDPVACDDPQCECGCHPCGDVDPHSPIDWITREQASLFCQWDVREGLPGRLPTEAEYERAIIGLGCPSRPYPWGNEALTPERVCMSSFDLDDPAECPYSPELGNFCPVDGRPAGETEDGVADLIGTVRVPTQDCYVEGYFEEPEAGGPDPVCGPGSGVEACAECTGGRYIWRGMGSGRNIHEPLAPLFSHFREPSFDTGTGFGIRCARDAR